VQPSKDGGRRAKVLNARPCEACEKKMRLRGIRRCYFTINERTLGVLEMQAVINTCGQQADPFAANGHETADAATVATARTGGGGSVASERRKKRKRLRDGLKEE